jgi:nitric oxide synthase oxygenase domain/subunit
MNRAFSAQNGTLGAICPGLRRWAGMSDAFGVGEPCFKSETSVCKSFRFRKRGTDFAMSYRAFAYISVGRGWWKQLTSCCLRLRTANGTGKLKPRQSIEGPKVCEHAAFSQALLRDGLQFLRWLWRPEVSAGAFKAHF